MVLREQRELLICFRTTRSAGSIRLSTQMGCQPKAGETRRAKQASSKDGFSLTAVVKQLTVVLLLQDLGTGALPLQHSLRSSMASIPSQKRQTSVS